MRFVVDSNVAIVANGNNTNASPACRLSTIDFLEQMLHRGRLVLDLGGEIEAEYRSHLNGGQPGVGNRFLQIFLNANASRIDRVHLTKDCNGNFDDFPNASALKNFDKSDRKFAAASKKSGAPVANATDTDWLHHKDALVKHGIVVNFICGCLSKQWFSNK